MNPELQHAIYLAAIRQMAEEKAQAMLKTLERLRIRDAGERAA